MTLTSVESWASPRLVENYSFVVFNGSDHLSYFNFTGKLLMDIKKSLYSFNLKVKSNESRKDYDIDLFTGNVDSCQAAKGIFGNFIIKFFQSNLDKHSNFKIDCPQKKGFYYAYNFPVPLDLKSFIPSFIPFRSSIWQLTVISRAKVSKSEVAKVGLQLQIKGIFISELHL